MSYIEFSFLPIVNVSKESAIARESLICLNASVRGSSGY